MHFCEKTQHFASQYKVSWGNAVLLTNERRSIASEHISLTNVELLQVNARFLRQHDVFTN